MEQFANSPLIQKLDREKFSDIFAPVNEVFENGKKQGIFKDVSTRLLAICAGVPMLSLAKAKLSGEMKVDDGVIEQAIEIAWDGIKVHLYNKD